MNALGRALAVELVPDGIRVNCICPGNVDTPMLATVPDEMRKGWAAGNPIGREAQPSEIAAVVRFLTSEDSSYITGQVIHVDGGDTAKVV